MGSATMLLLLAALLGFASASVEKLPPGGEASQDTRASGTCPDKWVDATFVDEGCLYFNNTESMTWDDANSMCQMVSKSTLLEITSEMQLSFIQMELAVIEDIEGTNHRWWTAATDVGINGQWYWIASRADVEDFVWYTNQPSPSNADWNCMYLYRYNYLGYSTICDNSRFPICQ